MGSWKVSDDLWYGEADLLPIGVLEMRFPTTSLVILAGDFNTLDDTDVIPRTALNSIVDQPEEAVSTGSMSAICANSVLRSSCLL